MIARESQVEVTAVLEGGLVRQEVYGAADLKWMAHDIWTGDVLTDDAEAAAFLHGFAAALDVLASGLLSQAYPLGCAVRALADVRDPAALPGAITDIARWAEAVRR